MTFAKTLFVKVLTSYKASIWLVVNGEWSIVNEMRPNYLPSIIHYSLLTIH